MSTPDFEPFVFTKKTVFMQRIADFARAGYTHHVGGVTTLDKLQGMANKFVERYRIDRDKSNAYKATQRGEAVARLLSWCDEKSPDRVYWVLMLKPEKAKTEAGTIKHRGGGVVLDQSEKWRDLTTTGGQDTSWCARQKKARPRLRGLGGVARRGLRICALRLSARSETRPTLNWRS